MRNAPCLNCEREDAEATMTSVRSTRHLLKNRIF